MTFEHCDGSKFAKASLTFEEAKDQVAKNHRRNDWSDLEINYTEFNYKCTLTFLEEAAELYARSMAAQAWEEGFMSGYSTGTMDDIANKPISPYKL